MPVAMAVPAMMSMPSMMPPVPTVVVSTPAVMTMHAMMMPAPVHGRRHGLGSLFRRRIRAGIDERHGLSAVGRRGHRKQAGNGGKSKNRSDIHLHEQLSLMCRSQTNSGASCYLHLNTLRSG